MGNCVARKRLPNEKTPTSEKKPQLASARNELTEIIGRLRNGLLVDIIDIGHGLLDTLRSLGVLTPHQIDVIERTPSASRQVHQLLDDVVLLDDERQQMFLLALEATGQKHVVSYLLGGGRRRPDASHADDWPAIASPWTFEAVERNYHELVETIDTHNGLLDELTAEACINGQHRGVIDACRTNASKNKHLLTIMRRRSAADYDRFVHCLVRTKQHRVVSLLEPDDADTVAVVAPLNEPQRSRLAEYRAVLIDVVDTRGGLVAELYAADCITRRQKEFVEAAATPAEGVGRLLDVVERGGQADFETFVDCLDRTGQRHASAIVLGRDSAAEGGVDDDDDVDEKIGGLRRRIEQLNENERQIVERFNSLRADRKGPLTRVLIGQLSPKHRRGLISASSTYSNTESPIFGIILLVALICTSTESPIATYITVFVLIVYFVANIALH